jgi:hypothetical protein
MQITFTGALQLLLIALKLLGHITWPWIWVLTPLWASWLFAAVILLVMFGLELLYSRMAR